MKKIAIVLTLVLFIALYNLFTQRQESLESSRLNEKFRAYKTLKKRLLMKDVSTQHNTVHQFGEELYKNLGSPGIKVCDDTYSYGCYHGFFSRAVATKGLSVIYDFDAECAKWENHGRCQHGIGHGILEYYGSDERLLDALGQCDKLKQLKDYAGCSGGVFMEYNFRTTRDRGKSLPRGYTVDNIRTPCSFLPKNYLETCYFNQPQWWNTVFRGNFKKIGDFCADLETERLQKACFEGSGNIIGPTQEFNLERSFKECDEISSQMGRVSCRIGLARVFAKGAIMKEEAKRICSELPAKEKSRCLQEI